MVCASRHILAYGGMFRQLRFKPQVAASKSLAVAIGNRHAQNNLVGWMFV